MECTYCGEALDDEEAASPQKDNDGDVMCDQCWSDKYEDVCQRCGEYRLKTDLKTEPGNLIAAWMEAPGSPDDLTPGYYRVKTWPIFVDYMIGGHMYSDALERVADLDKKGLRGAAEAHTCCGPLCGSCMVEIEERIKTPNAALSGPHEAASKSDAGPRSA